MSAPETTDIAELIFALERRLMDPVFRKDREAVSTLLAEDFREFGSSGRVWSRAEILDLLAGEEAAPAPAVEGFAVREIAPGAVLATYCATRPGADGGQSRSSLRSSVWVLRGGRWQVVFHQGTRIRED